MRKYDVGFLPTKKLILSILTDLNLNYKEVIIEAKGNKISKLLTVVEILRRLTHNSIDVKISYSFIEDDVENKNELLFNKLLIPVMYAEIRIKDQDELLEKRKEKKIVL